MTEELRVVPGTMLAAWPDLIDPNFMHTVVLMCQHNDEGAYGLVVNRATEVTTRDLMPDHPRLGRVTFPIHLGGPVDHRSIQFVHTVPDEIPGGLSLDGRIWLGGELEALARFVERDPDSAAARLRLFVGYSGWGKGQLERELAMGSWLPAPLSVEALFGGDQELAWRRVVRSIGKDGENLQNLPPDPSWN